MPLTFREAYDIVCPDGRKITPQCPQYKDILEMMKQSGYVPFQDKIAVEMIPKKPKTVIEAKRYMERPNKLVFPTKVSRRQWMSIESNRQKY
jgi:hypothetical protein